MKKKIALVATATALGLGSAAQAALVYTQNFDGMSTLALPAGWEANSTAATPAAFVASVNASVTTLNGSSGGNTYRFDGGAGGADRAIGILNSNAFTSPRSIRYTYTNGTGSTITALTLAWNYEKYRSGSRAFAFTFASTVGTPGTAGDQSSPADANNTVVTFNPPVSVAKTVTLSSLSLAAGATATFTWTLTGNGGSSNGQAVGLDDFSIDATTAASATAAIEASAVGTALGTANVLGSGGYYTIANVATGGATSGSVAITGDLATSSDPILVYLDRADDLASFPTIPGVTFTAGTFTFGNGVTYDAVATYSTRPTGSTVYFNFSGLPALNNVGIVPEPTALGLLVSSGLLIARRRR